MTQKHWRKPWLIDGRTVYVLNDDGCNIFSFQLHRGFTKYLKRVNPTLISVSEMEATILVARAAPDLLKVLKRAVVNAKAEGNNQ